MKKLFYLLFLLPAISLAQAPNLMSYQTVVWDTGNNLVVNSPVGFQMSILQGSITGPAVYVETHNVTTNANGLASFEIGAGAVVSGDIATIDWSNGPYYFKTEADPTGGTNYTITGTSQLLSVPYALYANVADSVVNDMVDDADPDPNNEIQTISQAGNVVTLSNGGGSVTFTSLDDDPTNELNTSATLVGTDLQITDAGGTLTVDLSSLVGSGVSGNATDELNTNLTLNNTTLELTDAGGTLTADLSSLTDTPVVENVGGNSSMCSGNTIPGADWVQYAVDGIYIDVNTSGCGFTSAPRYFCSMGGLSTHWELIGYNAIYLPTPTGFRVYVRFADGAPITTGDATTNGWFINWTAVGN